MTLASVRLISNIAKPLPAQAQGPTENGLNALCATSNLLRREHLSSDPALWTKSVGIREVGLVVVGGVDNRTGYGGPQGIDRPQVLCPKAPRGWQETFAKLRLCRSRGRCSDSRAGLDRIVEVAKAVRTSEASFS